MEEQESIMKVGYIAPMSIATVNGGVRTQALFTINHCSKLGIDPVFISPWDDLNEQKLDLIHVFGASVENSGIMTQVRNLKIPLVLSPVFFSNRSATVIKRAIKVEKMSTVIGSGIRSDFSIKADLCRQADLNLPNTQAEAELIENGFSVHRDKIQVVPNGVETRFKGGTPDLFFNKFGLKDFILFVGQASSPRKNVQKLLKIASEINKPVVIIGSFSNNAYGQECISLGEKAKNVTLIDTIDHEDELLASAYAACEVFVLPSYYETPGIAAMEAALTGSKIVVTKYGGTKDYFGDFAEYLDPQSESSLLKAIQKALNQKPSDQLKEHILSNYSWEKVAELTVQQYKKVLV